MTYDPIIDIPYYGLLARVGIASGQGLKEIGKQGHQEGEGGKAEQKGQEQEEQEEQERQEREQYWQKE